MNEMLCESHIASRFLWKGSGVTGDKKKFSVVSPSHPELDDLHRQDGFKEYLLCFSCEQHIGRYEKYAAQKLFQEKVLIQNRPDRHGVWTGLDYPLFKLFQMSILWRMGISKHPFYCRVELGEHQEVIRRMLKSEDPGEPWQYGCVAILLEHHRKPLLGLFSQPLEDKKFGHPCCSYAISGMKWVHFTATLSPDEKFGNLMLQRDGTWVLFRGEISEHLKPQLELFRQQHKEESRGANPNE